jgi:ABC-type transport system involved in cytochrome bd biosynthesis fused ATPase/permease subunit
MDSDEIKTNIQRTDNWLRGLHMLILMIAYGLAELLVVAIALFQFFTTILTRQTFSSLHQISRQLADYMRDIVLFLTYQTESKPFPYQEWGKTIQ